MEKASLGQRIRAARLALNLTQEAFAERVGVSPLTVIRWEQDRRIPRGSEVQRALIKLCGLHRDDFKSEKNTLLLPASKQITIVPNMTGKEEYVEVEIPPIKFYHGWREPRGVWPRTRVTVNGKTLPVFETDIALDPEKQTTYEWHYVGAGPRRLAASILADYFGETTRDIWRRQERLQVLQYLHAFKWEVVSCLPYEEWDLTGEEIHAWLMDVKQYPQKQKFWEYWGIDY